MDELFGEWGSMQHGRSCYYFNEHDVNLISHTENINILQKNTTSI